MSSSSVRTKDLRQAVALALAGLLAAAVLGLGVNGTLSTWTTAIVHVANNRASVVDALALQLSNSQGIVCATTASSSANEATCGSLNAYGNSIPMAPGESVTTTVTLTNVGSGVGALTVDGGPCTSDATGAADLCNIMRITIECPTGTTVNGGASLSAFGGAAATAVTTSLAAGASISCDITVGLPETAPAAVAGQSLTQEITWKLAR